MDNPTAGFMSPKSSSMGELAASPRSEGELSSPEISRIKTPEDTKVLLQLHNEGEALMQRCGLWEYGNGARAPIVAPLKGVLYSECTF